MQEYYNLRGYINVSAANLYRRPVFSSEICSQAVLWEKVEIIGRRKAFLKVVAEDGYKGWKSEKQISPDSGPVSLKMVYSPKVDVHDATGGNPIGEAVTGSYIKIISEKEGWHQIGFPDGRLGWVKRDAFGTPPEPGRESVVQTAKSFLGAPYFWGGKTRAGIDCSGFTQLVHKLHGIRIPRDSGLQHKAARFVSDDPLKGMPGDLLFFVESGRRITHVAIRMEGGRIIHASGRVRIQSLSPDDDCFNPKLGDTFVCVKTFLSSGALSAP